jgi:hypothetical protein
LSAPKLIALIASLIGGFHFVQPTLQIQAASAGRTRFAISLPFSR